MGYGRRRRSGGRIIHRKLTEVGLPDFSKESKLGQLVSKVEGILRQPAKARKWNTVRNVRKSLRCHLELRSLWLQIREQWIKDITVLDGKVAEAWSNAGSSLRLNLPRHRSSTANTINATETVPGFSTVEDILDIARSRTKSKEYAKLLDSYYCQSLAILHDMPAWLNIKKFCPIGGRKAYSILMACNTGKMHDNLPYEDKLFGWHDIENLDHKLMAFKWAKLSLIPRLEPKGDAPSVVSGRHELKVGNIRFTKPDFSKSARLGRVNRWIEDHLLGVFGRYNAFYATSLAVQMHRIKLDAKNGKGHDYSVRGGRFLRKIGVNMQTVSPAIITNGIPERVTINDQVTNDYILPAMWSDGSGIVHGWVFARVGWDDVYHYGGIVPPTAEQVHNQLSLSTEAYFERQRRNLENKASRELQEVERKKEVANYIRKLRHVEVVTLNDSYAVGNCQPGTKEFCDVLKITTDTINGRELAKRWYKAKYISQDKFLPVIKAAVQKHEKALELWQLTILPNTASFASVDEDAPVPVSNPVSEGEGHEEVQQVQQEASQEGEPQAEDSVASVTSTEERTDEYAAA